MPFTRRSGRATLSLAPLALLGAAACGSAPSSLANRAPATDTAPLRVAVQTSSFGVAIAAVDHNGVRTLATIDGATSFGWVDPHTLFALDSAGSDTTSLKLVRAVDGNVADTVTVSEQEWPTDPTWLILARAGTAWVGRCAKHSYASSEPECVENEYLRLWPAPRTRATAPPRSDIPTAETNERSGTWPYPPATAAPPGVTLSKKRRTVHSSYGSTRDIDTITCERGTQRLEYPDPKDWDTATGFDIESTRWVNVAPPIFELYVKSLNPVSEVEELRYYLRPCELPMDGFAWLGDGRWASYKETEQEAEAGTWTFYDGERVLGTLAGFNTLRSNRFGGGGR